MYTRPVIPRYLLMYITLPDKCLILFLQLGSWEDEF